MDITNLLTKDIIKKTWGIEYWVENNEKYCCKVLVVFRGKWNSEGLFHKHLRKDETFLVIEGELILDLGGIEYRVLKPFDSYRVLPGKPHRFTALTDKCVFIEASTHHDEEDSIRGDLKELMDGNKETEN